ncbi:MAG: hypothetical protein WC291_04355 [Thermodesulfovibrionales bacterium]|jgi:hypothetical protein
MDQPGHAGRSFKAIASDISEGYVTVNPIFLKSFDRDSLKALYQIVERKQAEIRSEPFPYHEIQLIRQRNIKLQRLYSAQIVIRNFAREKNMKL